MIAFDGRLGLRRASALELPALHAIDLEADEQSGWRLQGAIPSEHERTARLWADSVLDQRVLIALKTGQVIGYTTLYDHDPQAQTAWIAIVSRGDRRLTAWPMMGLALFAYVVFREWPLRKIYAEVTADTLTAFSSIVEGGQVREVGRFVDRSVRPDGTPVDVIWLELDRLRWEEAWAQRVGGRVQEWRGPSSPG